MSTTITGVVMGMDPEWDLDLSLDLFDYLPDLVRKRATVRIAQNQDGSPGLLGRSPGLQCPLPCSIRCLLALSPSKLLRLPEEPSGLGIVVSLIALVLASFTVNPQLAERAKGGIAVSVGALALLYIGVAAANYAGHLFGQ